MKKKRTILLKIIMKKQIGKTFEVLIEDATFDGKYYIGRSKKGLFPGSTRL